MSTLTPIDYLNQNQERIIQTYRDLHELAEPSWEEKRTSDYLLHRLEEVGYSVQQFEGHYGLIAQIEGETSDVVALRADMDALVQDVDGVVKANHSCGHDAHSTMVLHTAIALASGNLRPYKTVRFIFQPAEEKGEGALQLITDGALNNVKMLLGVHLRPVMEVPYGKAAPAILHGASTSIRGVIKGLQAHAARPQNGKNPIEAASFLIQALQGIRLQAGDPFSVKMTQLHAGGESSNIIPDKATFTLDMRAQTNEGMAELKEKTVHTMETVAALTGTSIEWESDGYSPAATLNDKMIKLAAGAIAKVLGPENLAESCVTQGGEDFHFYALENPDLSATMIGLGSDLRPGLHHPHMSFRLDALVYGTKILTTALLEAAISSPSERKGDLFIGEN
ncbi:M20 peptidase aminoacylase family protein [Brevibacillus sp. NRS-1366]|uniref:M20 peptidase aminoacylase family protein n=1 Tax=Brevibacillus sp. NRS-1366 TaxID=3233899 RepID=UPI003D1DF13A